MIAIRLALLLGLMLSLLLPGAPRAQEVVFPGTAAIGLVPPPGLRPASRFQGFENPDTGAAVTIAEMPPEALAQIIAGFTPEALAQRGLLDAQRDMVRISGREALLVSARSAAGPVLILVAGSPETTAVVTARPGTAPEGMAQMRAALLAASFRAPRTLDQQVAALPFRLTAQAGFQPVQTLGGTALVLRLGGGEDRSRPTLTIAASIGAAPPPAAVEAFARRALAGLPALSGVEVLRAGPARFGATEWFEIEARATWADGQTPGPLAVRQAILMRPDGYVRAVLIAPQSEATAVAAAYAAVLAGLEPVRGG